MKALLASVLVGSLITVWLDFCLGGVIFRYTSDITLPLALITVLSLFFICEEADSTASPYLGKGARAFSCVFMLWSVTVMLLLGISHNGNLAQYSAEKFVYLMHFFGIQ